MLSESGDLGTHLSGDVLTLLIDSCGRRFVTADYSCGALGSDVGTIARVSLSVRMSVSERVSVSVSVRVSATLTRVIVVSWKSLLFLGRLVCGISV